MKKTTYLQPAQVKTKGGIVPTNGSIIKGKSRNREAQTARNQASTNIGSEFTNCLDGIKQITPTNIAGDVKVSADN